MTFGMNTTRDISKLSQNFTRLTAREITYNDFEISLVVVMPNITTNNVITYTNTKGGMDGETSRRLKRIETGFLKTC